MFQPYAYQEVTIFHSHLFPFTIINYQVETKYTFIKVHPEMSNNGHADDSVLGIWAWKQGRMDI